jgi:hypothetical protein
MSYGMLPAQGDVAAAKATAAAFRHASGARFRANRVNGGIERLERCDGIEGVKLKTRHPDSGGTGPLQRRCRAVAKNPIVLLINRLGDEAGQLVAEGRALLCLFRHRLDDYLLPKCRSSVSARAASIGSLIKERSPRQAMPNSISDAIVMIERTGPVSDWDESEVLPQQSCPRAQGHHLSRLAPVENFGRLMDRAIVDAAYP